MNDPAGWRPQQHLDALARLRAATDGAATTTWWTGDVYTWGPGESNAHVFGFEGLNVARAVAVDGGYELLARECAFYLDSRSREILGTWDNPRTGQSVEVVHVWNDPVNQRWLADGPRGPFRLPWTRLGDRLCVNMDIPLTYPSPLPTSKFPENSADDLYRALELFQFYGDAAEIADPAVSCAACELSWMRMSPWLPWMAMGDRPGGLVFHCRGYKLGSYDEVPQRTRDYIAARHPEFAEAPTAWSEPNETSWTYFKKLVESDAAAS